MPHPGGAWATALSQNVQYCDEAAKTKDVPRLLPTADIANAPTVNYGPKVLVKNFHLNHIEIGHNKSSPLDGATPLGWMVGEAKKDDVSVT